MEDLERVERAADGALQGNGTGGRAYWLIIAGRAWPVLTALASPLVLPTTPARS